MSCLLAVLVVMGLVVAPIAYVASPAGATSLGNVLILSTSVTGGSTSAEAAAVTADGYTPVIDTGTTWDSLSQSGFSAFSAIILGDPTCSTSASTSVGAAVSDVSTWSPAVTGNVVIAGASPVAAAGGANPQGASAVTKDAVAYALASGSGKTGLYVSLSCYYSGSGSGTSVPVLGGLGTFTVGGGVASTDSGTLNVPVEDGAASFRGLTNAGLLGWSASVQETFGSWPTNYQPLAVDNSATPSDFTGTDGLTGRPYILVNNASTPSSFAGAVGGVVPTSATYGGSDAASPGVSDGTTTAGKGVNPENGDFTTTANDASASTYGPALSLNRTYDSKLAQAESVTGTPGAFGYGWSTNYGATLKLNSPIPNDIYTAQTGFSAPQDEAFDAAGDLYIADTSHNRITEIPAATGTQWGISMTAGTKYTVAGSSSGTAGSTGNGGAATSALLHSPTAVAFDAAGDLFISDSVNHRIQEVAASTGTQWGISMTANDVYTVLGTTGTAGCTGNGTAATSAHIDDPTGLTIDSSGNLIVADYANNRIVEVAKATGTNWGISMTANDEYTVAGHSSCASGISGDGGAATSAYLNTPRTVSVDGAGDLVITDSTNDRVQAVASATGTQWGISMTANDVYTIAGSATGSHGVTGDGGAATSALLNYPIATAFDPAGDLFITDSANNRIQEVAKSGRVQWATALTANDIYTVAGASCGCSGSTGDGGVATSALLNNPQGLAIDSSGSLYIADTTNNSVREVVATSPSTWSGLTPTPSAITVNQGNGAQVTFIPPVSGACPSPYVGPGTTGTYCAQPYVTATLNYNSGTGTYTLVDHPYATSTFSSTGQLTGESMAGGATLAMTYGNPAPGSGNCPSTAASCNTVTSASGRALTIGLNSSSLVTSVTDPLGNKWTYAYTSGNLTSVTDPMSRVTSFSYDTSNSNPVLVHDLLTMTEPNGQSGGSHAGAKLTNTYNGSGQVTTQVDPSGWSTGFNYGSMNTALGNGDTVVTDPDGNESEYLYSTGVLDAKVVGYGSSVPSDSFYTLSTLTLLPSSMTDPDGGVTSMTYDASGNVLTKTDQLGRETTDRYNGFDEVVCSTKPLAASPCSSLSPPAAVSPGATITPPSSAPPAYVTYALYDTSGNQLWQTQGVYQPGGSTASYSRTTYHLYSGNSVSLNSVNDSCGATPPTSLACAIIDANTNVTQLVYNSNGDQTSSAILDGNPSSELATTTDAYDADGNQTSMTAPAGNLPGANAANYTTTTTYDADHEPLVVTLAGGTGSTITPTITATYYDPDGNKAATTGALGNPYSASNTSGCNPITTTTCSDTTYNTLNADNEQTLSQDPSGNQTLSCYDGDGNVAQTVPPFGVNANSLTPTSCPSSYPSGYSSTALATDATMTTFNAQGQPTVLTAPPSTGGSSRVTTTNTYDPAKHLIETSAPPSGGTGGSNQVSTTTYDLAGQTTTMTTGFGTSASSTSSDCYDPDGDQTATVPGTANASGVVACGTTSPWTTGSTLQSTSSYDSVGEVVGTVAPPPAGQTANATTSATYDANGNVLTSTDANSVVTTNTYSPLNRLISSSSSGSSNSTNYYGVL